MSLHDDFLAIDLAAIDRFVAERRHEDLRLDFKTLPSSPKLTREDRKNLAIALTGFANSDGGVVVWGVEAKKDEPDDPDAACAKQPIRSAATVAAEYQTLTGQAGSPALDGVEHRVILESAAEGYIVTHVPASGRGPHMAKLGENRYYKRSGGSFRCLEHFDLEDMFGRRPKPTLEITVKPHVALESFAGTQVDLIVGLRNTGRGIARFPYLRFNSCDAYTVNPYGLDGNSSHGLRPQTMVLGIDRPMAYLGGSNDVVHPGDELLVARLSGTPRHKPPDARIVYWIGAEGTAEVHGTELLSTMEIEAAIGR